MSRLPNEIVLQLHAVDDPRDGLFRPDRARTWIRAMAARSSAPFRVSLPAYGARVGFDPSGRVAAVEAETPVLAGAGGLELIAPPIEVATFARALDPQETPGLVGLVWFRLPVATDRRAWSMPTWRTVMSGAPLRTDLTLRRRISSVGASEIILDNQSDIDTVLPDAIPIAAACGLADGLWPYNLDRLARTAHLVLAEPALLPARHALAVGWTRCAGGRQ